MSITFLRRDFVLCVFAVALSILAGAPACAQIKLHTDFESGSLDLLNSSVNENEIRLRGIPTWTQFPNGYRWVYFRASGVNGVQPRFQIGSSDNEFLGDLAEQPFYYSYDQSSWSPFDQFGGNNADYSFRNLSPFTQDSVYVAYAVPYEYSRTVEKMAEWSSSSHVSPTMGAATDFSVGTVANTTSHGPSELELYGFRVTDENSQADKQKILLFGGNHSGEVGADWALEGLVDFALSDDPTAIRLRRTAELIVYPQIDPLGRVEGYYRSNSQGANNDHNRFWNAPATGNNGGFSEIDIINQDIKEAVGTVDYSLDFHGFWSSGDHFVFSDSTGINSDFFTALQALEPATEIAIDNSTEPAGILEFWAKTTAGFSAEYSFTPEFPPNWLPEEYKRYGMNYTRALSTTIAGQPGDLNRDNLVDASDIDLLYGALDSSDLFFDVNLDGQLSLADVDNLVEEILGTQYGDANLDQTVDQQDFAIVDANLFAENTGWAAGNFNGDIGTDVADFNLWLSSRNLGQAISVPEPSGLCLLLGLLLMSSIRRPSARR